MDDCDLDKLSAAPAKLDPKFNKKVTEYSATVPSNVEKVKIDCLTSDSGASYQIVGSGGEKVIPLTEGAENEIKIEVTAEDGTVKNYILIIKRLSASDAVLSTLGVSDGNLEPAFSMGRTEYVCKVPCTAEEITIKATAPDKQCEILVDGNPLDQPVSLNLGETKTLVSVKSVDGKNTQEYMILICRKQLLWPIFLSDQKTAARFECPMTLSPLHCPVSINGSEPKVVMSQQCIDMLTRRSKVNPLDETNLEPNWRCVEYEMDKDITACLASSVYAHKGCKDQVTLGKIAHHAAQSEHKPKQEVDTAVVTGSDWYKAEFEGTSTSASSAVDHTVQVRNWEKRLQRMAGETNPEKLIKEAESKIKKYRQSLPKVAGDMARFADGESPVDHLHRAGICYAAAVKEKPKDASVHLKFAQVLEEEYYLQDMYGLEKEDDEAAGSNMAAKESSKDDDCAAICKLRGVSGAAPLALQLKAIDEEYHSLLDSGQSSKADYVMALYAWKSKQALKSGQAGLKSADDNNPLGRSYLKYLDALSLRPNDHVYNLHVARMMLAQDNHAKAIQRLQQAVGLKPSNAIGRFYLGLALLTQEGGPGPRLKEALNFLHEGLEQMLLVRLNEATAIGDVKTASTDLHCEDPWRISNIQVLRGIYSLAKSLEESPQQGFRSPKEIYHCLCLHASVALCSLHAKNDIHKQLEWLILDCHYSLLELMMKENAPDQERIAQRCRYLSSVIRNVTIPQSDDLLQLQQKVCEKLVTIQPCSSHGLYLLGMSQLARYDNDPKTDLGERSLKDCRLSFHASISLEGKTAAGDVPAEITNQKWWQDRIAAEKAKQQPVAKAAPAAAAAGRGRGAPRGPARGAPARGRGAARGAPPARGAPAPRGRGAPVPARGARGGRGGVTAPTASSSNTSCDKPDPKAEQATATPAAPSGKPAPINRTTHHARLGLARALSRTEDTIKDAQLRYEEVMKMAPEVHDAYIELAEILIKTDPLAAVDIYCRFPRSDDENSFDDAYLSGEIVHILMKNEKFDDPRLCEHMVAWGRVMGIGVLEKYMDVLDAKFKTNLLKKIYAGVHKKAVDDPDLEAFFKFKCWI